jgi:hypothetical protein
MHAAFFEKPPEGGNWTPAFYRARRTLSRKHEQRAERQQTRANDMNGSRKTQTAGTRPAV